MVEYWDSKTQCKLWAPTSYITASPEEISQHCNGMGPLGVGFLVPDTMYGLDVGEAGYIHDWMFTFPEGKTKEECDEMFLRNMNAIIEAQDSWSWVKWLRKRRAKKYYLAVKLGGDEHFASP